MRSIYSILVIIVFFSNILLASSQSATFFHSEDSLLSKLIFPKIKGNTTTFISCSGVIKKNKKIENVICYKNQAGDEIYIQEIYRVIKKSRFTPAQINKKPVAVFIQFRILFKQTDDESKIKIFSNSGYEENVSAYGMNYIGAQRLIGKEKWVKNCPKYNRYRALSKTHVAPSGQASNANLKLLNGIKISDKCANSILSSLNHSQYIPAFKANNTLPSTYIELFGN